MHAHAPSEPSLCFPADPHKVSCYKEAQMYSRPSVADSIDQNHASGPITKMKFDHENGIFNS